MTTEAEGQSRDLKTPGFFFPPSNLKQWSFIFSTPGFKDGRRHHEPRNVNCLWKLVRQGNIYSRCFQKKHSPVNTLIFFPPEHSFCILDPQTVIINLCCFKPLGCNILSQEPQETHRHSNYCKLSILWKIYLKESLCPKPLPPLYCPFIALSWKAFLIPAGYLSALLSPGHSQLSLSDYHAYTCKLVRVSLGHGTSPPYAPRNPLQSHSLQIIGATFHRDQLWV